MVLQELQRDNEPLPFDLGSLDPSDPIDSLMLDYQQAVIADRLPSAAHEELLVAGIKQGNELAALQLVRSHKGLVATIAHRYKQPWDKISEQPRAETNDLLLIGTRALLQSANTYAKSSELGFTDHGIIAIDAALAASRPEASPAKHDEIHDRPMERIFKYMAGIQTAREREAEHQSALEGFSPLQKRILPLLTLQTHDKIATALNVPLASVQTAICRCFAKTGTNSTTALALDRHEKGLKYVVPGIAKPLVDIITSEDFIIGNNLDLEYEEIAAIIDPSYEYDDIRWKVASMKRKTGASTRVELALQLRIYDTGERISADSILAKNLGALAVKLGVASLEHSDVELMLQDIPASQSEAIRPYYLSGQETSWHEVGQQTNISATAARIRAGRGIKSMKASTYSVL